jgi:hypothetical protein
MSATLWTKFYWTNWLGNVSLRRSSIAARGFWMDVLSIAAQNDPIGYVDLTGADFFDLMSRISGVSEADAKKYTAELEKNGVFSRDRYGRLYCRRMVRDNAKLQEAIKSGRRGGRISRDKKKGIFKPSEGTPEGPQEQASELDTKMQRN